MKHPPLVSIIIVNYNGGSVFRDCLRSLSKVSYKDFELIIVDNGSTDKSETGYKRFKRLSAVTTLVRNKKNIGFAPANNQGYKKSKGKYILLLNNDTKVTKNFLSLLVERLSEEKEIAVIQPKIYLMDKPGYLDTAGSFMTRTGFLQHWGYMRKDSKEFNKEKYIFSAKGACMLIKRKVIEEVGLFDGDYVSYFEESDFCWRVWMSGYKVLYYPKANIRHKVGYTSSQMNQVRVTYISTKNRVTSLFKYFEMKNIALISIPHVIFLMMLGTYQLLRLKPAKAWMLYHSVFANVVDTKSILRKRARAQKLRKLSDRKLFVYMMRGTDIRGMFNHFFLVESNFK